MTVESWLVVVLRGHRFALAAADVQEVARLPALAPLAEAPPHVAGLMDLRGRLVPVVDLAQRMGYEPIPRSLAQSVVVLARRDADEPTLTGVIVDGVEGLEDVDDARIEDAPESPRGVVPMADAVVRRVAHVGRGAAVLLDPEDVVHRARPEDLERPQGELAGIAFDAPPEALDEFRERARRLAAPPSPEDVVEAPPLVLVRIGGETFAVPAASALEFVRLDDLAPVPCAPRHIAGHASLRGDVVVVVDVGGFLGVAGSRAEGGLVAMLVRPPQGGLFGILVEDVLGVAEGRDARPMPDAASSTEFIRESVVCEGRRVPVLELDDVAGSPRLVVKED